MAGLTENEGKLTGEIRERDELFFGEMILRDTRVNCEPRDRAGGRGPVPWRAGGTPGR